jgi:AraC family transcriptional regulator
VCACARTRPARVVSLRIECAIGKSVRRARNTVVGSEPQLTIEDFLGRVMAALGTDPNVVHRLSARAVAALLPTAVRDGRREGRSTADAVSHALAPWQLDRILIYIEDNIAQPLHNTDLAQVIGLSTSYFSRSFVSSAGISPARYVRRRRTEFACRLMSGTRMSLCQIAIASGLCDQAHLCRTFQAFFRETPSSWRRARASTAPLEK